MTASHTTAPPESSSAPNETPKSLRLIVVVAENPALVAPRWLITPPNVAYSVAGWLTPLMVSTPGVVRLVRPAGELLADPDVARLYLGGQAAAAK